MFYDILSIMLTINEKEGMRWLLSNTEAQFYNIFMVVLGWI